VDLAELKGIITTNRSSCQVVKGDKEAEKKLPKVMKDDIKASKPSNSRSYSTSAIRRQDLSSTIHPQPPDAAIVDSGMSLMRDPTTQEPANVGHKFGLPTLPLPSNQNLHHRYEPIVEQLTGLLIRHGKKAVAQRVRC
jgi:small subunit ribosomal protein S7